MTAGRRGRPSGWAPSSIRLRLLTGLLALLVLGMAASTATSAALLLDFLHDRSEQTLREAADRVEQTLTGHPQTVDPDQLVTLLGDPMGIVVEDAAGQVAGTSGSGEIAPEAVLQAASAVPPGEMVTYDSEDDLLAVRILTPDVVLLASDDGDPELAPAALVLTIDPDVDADTVHDLIARQTLLVVGFLMVMAVLAGVVLKLGLRPLRRMAGTAEAIAAGSLTERLPVEDRATETDGLARAVNRAFDAQARAEANARTFAADASHELRTPLATLSGWLDLYQQGALTTPEQVGDAIGHIDAEVGRMRLIVEELGLLARLDAGRPLERADVDLVALAASVVEDAQVIDPDRGITLTAQGPVHLAGDAPRLQQVLRNLVGNAVQHTPAGTAVQLTVAPRGDRAVLTVADTGPGIAPEHLPRVFERFWRAEASRSRAYGGSGLGLAIVQAIVQAHGGTVSVSSTTTGTTGTTVEVSLPR